MKAITVLYRVGPPQRTGNIASSRFFRGGWCSRNKAAWAGAARGLILGFGCLVLPVHAFAQSAGGDASARHPKVDVQAACYDDVQRMCPDATSVRDRIMCLKFRRPDVSLQCRKALNPQPQ